MSDTIFKKGTDVIGVMDGKLDTLCKAASVIIFLGLVNAVLLCIILSLVIYGVMKAPITN